MTICVSVKVAEGLVLAADSAVMLQGELRRPDGHVTEGLLQSFSYANKVTHFKNYPIGILNWGLASIRDRSIQSLIMEYEHEFLSCENNPDYTVRDIAEGLGGFIQARYDSMCEELSGDVRPGLGLLIGGYSEREFFPEEYMYNVEGDRQWVRVRPNKPDGSPNFGANWYGQTIPLTRLIKGIDPYGLDVLAQRGINSEILQKWINDSVSEAPLIFDGMPLQDAIDFALYAAEVVIGWFRFTAGPELCGGDVDIAVITPNAFHWAQRKQWAIK